MSRGKFTHSAAVTYGKLATQSATHHPRLEKAVSKSPQTQCSRAATPRRWALRRATWRAPKAPSTAQTWACGRVCARLLDVLEGERQAQLSEQRRAQIGSGDRSERIRTYNFPQSRLTDHRIQFTLYKLEEIMTGKLDEVVEALSLADRTAKLQAVEG